MRDAGDLSLNKDAGAGRPPGGLESCLEGAPAPKPRRGVTFCDAVDTRPVTNYKGRHYLWAQKLEAERDGCRCVVKGGSFAQRPALTPHQGGYLGGDTVYCVAFGVGNIRIRTPNQMGTRGAPSLNFAP